MSAESINKDIFISKENQEKIYKWLNEKCIALRCFCCGIKDLSLVGEATSSIGYNLDTTRMYYGVAIPSVQIICKNCGYIHHFNPMVMGVTQKESSEMPEAVSSAQTALVE